jgi:hypothetical protein
MTRIIVELEGGMVTAVYCSDPDANASLIDRDIFTDGYFESEEDERDLIRKAEEEIIDKNLTVVY